MLQRSPTPLAVTLLALTVLLPSCNPGAPGDGGPGGEDTGTAAADVSAPEDLEADIRAGQPPLVITDGDALRPMQEDDLLALITIDAGGTICLSYPWNEECVTRVRLLDLTDGAPLYSSTDVYATSVPILKDKVLYWTGPDNRLRYHEYGAPGVVKPLEGNPDFYGIQAPVLVRDGGIYWYAYDYTAGTYGIHRYDVETQALTMTRAVQHEWPYFMSELGAPLGPQFDVSEDHVVWLHYRPYGDTWHYRILQGLPGADGDPAELPTGDVNCIWPRIKGDWVYYLWFAQEHWECSQLKCFFHVGRVHLETGAVEQLDDDEARVTGLYPPLLWDGGTGWLDFRSGTYRVVLRPDGGDPVAVTPPERPVGLFSGVDLVPLDDGRLRVLWSTLFDGRLQIFAADWEH